ncbi:chemotaxis protein CheA [Aureimonas jatrophae]|jgi:two-component system, chemotaxis family, sensor kinase CheA|uniref:Chemotaxis protein CheA n=1 Tax=Aureimonas jatrophae TaxID=1166073 RepID=A0A1H0CTL7_9HYPH|nr:chemotaxis protein CheA [Aureimonas jatrophae]MBB3951643.1 two-component system chemotaxis sensor kinase CheA [Aureimonas jatrophae]SDN61242.1 two-component system, chemotaxis family, sensor kinase CheA [Aureimonas jatrophae]
MSALDEIRVVFFQECDDQLQELEDGLNAMSGGETDDDTVNRVFRAVHSIKGGAGAFDLHHLVRFAHVFETVLDEVRSHRLEAGDAVMAVMLRSADHLRDLVAAGRDGEAADEARSAELINELETLIGGPREAHGAAEGDDEDGGASLADFEFTPVAVDWGAMLGGDGAMPAFGEPAALPTDGPLFQIAFTPRRELYAKANEAAVILRQLGALGEMSVACDTSRVPTLDAIDPEDSYLSFAISLDGEGIAESAVREVFEFAEWDCELEITPRADAAEPDVGGLAVADLLARLQSEIASEPDAPATAETRPEPVVAAEPKPAAAAKPAKDESGEPKGGGEAPGVVIRVELTRVDKLIDLVGELVTTQTMLAQRIEEAELPTGSEIAGSIEELDRLTRTLQDSVMAVRAQPVKSVFQRMPRLVRETASATGKRVNFVTQGENTEVDKTVVERLSDPLTHMIRNAIDHGLEKPEDRLAKGKPAEGTVTLSAAHRSGRIIIEIADDGAGINRPKVRQIAVDKGLISADAMLSDEEIDQLVMLPGFSTASTVSAISGRGVGMDVVKQSIEALGGRLVITSRPGLGSTFTMSLPLTLAVLEGMIVRVENETLVVPLGAIVFTFRPQGADLQTLGQGRTVNVRGSIVPLIDVGTRLGYRETPADPLQGVAILVECDNNRRVALQVDEIRGQRQVVIKSLERNYRPVTGISAATISGEGRVALILDVDALAGDKSLDSFIFGLDQVAAE